METITAGSLVATTLPEIPILSNSSPGCRFWGGGIRLRTPFSIVAHTLGHYQEHSSEHWSKTILGRPRGNNHPARAIAGERRGDRT